MAAYPNPHTPIPLSPLRAPLPAGQVHAWWVDLNTPGDQMPGRIAMLSPDERDRAARFRLDLHRDRYIAGRAYLRQVLGGLLGQVPATLFFDYSPLGKPGLARLAGSIPLHFNLSNAEDRALIAVASVPLGVDLERVRPMPDDIDLARRFFCPSEIDLLESHFGAERAKLFFQIWTAKEAFLKAVGEGLSRPINEVEVALHEGRATLLSIAGDQIAARSWSLALFSPEPGWQAALALPLPAFTIHQHNMLP